MARSPRPVRALPSVPTPQSEEGVRTGLVARIVIVTTVVLGQLWALTIALEAYLSDHGGQAWLLAGFSVLSFAVVVVLARIEPATRWLPRTRGTRPSSRYVSAPVPGERQQ